MERFWNHKNFQKKLIFLGHPVSDWSLQHTRKGHAISPKIIWKKMCIALSFVTTFTLLSYFHRLMPFEKWKKTLPCLSVHSPPPSLNLTPFSLGIGYTKYANVYIESRYQAQNEGLPSLHIGTLCTMNIGYIRTLQLYPLPIHA